MDAHEASELAARYLEQLSALGPHQSLAATSSEDSVEAAYLVQDAFHSLLLGRGERLAGYKVALTSAAMQEFCGVNQPLAGAVFESVVHDSPASIDLSAHRHLGVECEVAVRLSMDLGPGSGPHTRESIRSVVASCHPAFELIEDRNADYSQLNAFDLVSENAWNAAVVIGDPASDWATVDLETAGTKLEIGGELVGEGRTGDALGHPFEAVAWLANHLNERGRTLEAGQFVMTGSSVVTQFPEPGDELCFKIDGLGQVQAACS